MKKETREFLLAAGVILALLLAEFIIIYYMPDEVIMAPDDIKKCSLICDAQDMPAIIFDGKCHCGDYPDE